MSLPPPINAMLALSGENMQPVTPDSGISMVSALSSRRANTVRKPFLTPMIATTCPSGESANPLSSPGMGSISGGNTMSKFSIWGALGPPGPLPRSAHPATNTATAVIAHGTICLSGLRRDAAGGALSSAAPSSRAIRASASNDVDHCSARFKSRAVWNR